MKIIILMTIQMYWMLIPKQKRRKCIFKKSCSIYVYEKTLNSGFIAGLKAFWFRFKNCRGNIEILKNPSDNSILVLLSTKTIVESDTITDNIINQYNL